MVQCSSASRQLVFSVLILLFGCLLSIPGLADTPELDIFGRVVSEGGERILHEPGTDQARRQAMAAHRELEDRGTAAAPAGGGPPLKNSLSVVDEWDFVIYGVGIGAAGLELADFDGSGTYDPSSIVASAGLGTFGPNRYWYSLFEEVGDFFMTWHSPLYSDDITSLVAHDVDGDGDDEVVLGVGSTLEIWDQAAGSFTQTATRNVAASSVEDLVIADVDGDGQLEAIFCGGFSSLWIYDLSSGGLELQSSSFPCRDLAVGNVDGDGGLEIVVANGFSTSWVLDGASRAIEWAKAGGFGVVVEVADVDGDGMDEIVAGFGWQKLELYDADTQSTAWSHTTSLEVAALWLGDADGDSQPEVVYGDGQWGSVHILDAATGAAEDSVPNTAHGVTDITVLPYGKVVWGSGFSSSGRDHLNLYDLATATTERVTVDHRGPFYALDSAILDGSEAVLYGSYETESGYGDGRWVARHAAGFNPIYTSPEPTHNSNLGLHRVRFGSLGSGLGDAVFITTDSGSFGKVIAYDAVTKGEIWQSASFQGIAFQAMAHADVDSDGAPEIVALGGRQFTTSDDGSYVFVFDAQSGATEWQSASLGAGLMDLPYLRVANVDGDAAPEIVAGSANGFLWIYDGQSKSLERSNTNLDIGGIETADPEGDGVHGIWLISAPGQIVAYDPVTDTTPEFFTAGSVVDGLQARDFDLDGSLDFAYVADGRLQIYSGLSDSVIWQSPVLGAAAGRWDSLLAGDFDLDGKVEMWVNNGLIGMRIFEIQVSVSNNAPTVSITDPGDGSIVAAGQTLSLTATASDIEDGDLSAALAWSSNLDGSIGTGNGVLYTPSAGGHLLTASVTDSGGFVSSDTVSLTVQPVDQPPVVTIDAPPGGSSATAGDSVTFEGTASDDVDGDLSAALAWTSDLDGSIGTGASFSTSSLSVGSHLITASVFDSQSQQGSSQIALDIDAAGGDDPVLTITAPANGSGFPSGAVITFAASATDSEGHDISEYIFWTSSIDGTYEFAASTFDWQLSDGLHTITADVEDPFSNAASASILVAVGTDPPTSVVTITAPLDESSRDAFLPTTLTAVATDPGGADISSSITWSSSLDGALGSGPSVTVTLSDGSHVITAGADDGQGNTAEASITFHVGYNSVPYISIFEPANWSGLSSYDAATGEASAYDSEDGDLSADLVWTSDLDGQVSTGAFLDATLSAGIHDLTVSATDSQGRTGSASITVFVHEGSGPPLIRITRPDDGSTFGWDAVPVFYVIAHDREDGLLSHAVEWWVDGSFEGTGADFDYLYGSGTIEARVSGSGQTASDFVTVTVVPPAPVVSVSQPVDGSLVAIGADLQLAATATDDDGFDVSSSLSWSSNLDGALGSGPAVTVFGGLSEGRHRLTASVDLGGLVGSETVTVHVAGATGPPAVTITEPARDASIPTGQLIVFEATAWDPDEGDLSTGISWYSSVDGFLGTGSTYQASYLSLGRHVITADTVDSAGLLGQDTLTVTITNTPPRIRISAPEDLQQFQSAEAILFDAVITDAEDGAMSYFALWRSDLDGILGYGYPSLSYSDLSSSTHRIRATVEDSWGVVAYDQIEVVIAPNNPPAVTITAPADGSSVFAGDDVDLSADAVDPEQGDVSASLIWTSDLDGQIAAGSPATVVTLSPGSHTITAQAVDSQGAQGNDSVTLTVAVNQAPQVTILTPADGASSIDGQVVDLTASASDEDGDLSSSIAWESSLDGPLGVGAAIQAGGLAVGSHTLTAQVTDSRGAVGSASITFTVVANAEPVVTISAPLDASSSTATDPVAFAATAADAEDGDVTSSLVWTSSADGQIGTGGSFQSSTLSTGQHLITATATDSLGVSGFSTVTITVAANQLPAVSITAPAPGAHVVEGASVSFAGTASDSEDGDLAAALVWTSDLDGQIGTGASFTSASLSVGEHQVRATATDSHGGAGFFELSLFIDANTAPSVHIDVPSGPSPTFIESDPVTFGASASDAEDGDLAASLVWTSDLDGQIGTGGTFITSALSVGLHTITATATDSHGAEGSDAITVTVSSNDPPSVTISSPSGPISVIETDAVSFVASASDAQDGSLSASIAWSSSLDGALGTGASLNTSSLTVGVHTITASVTDSHGAEGSDAITVTVSANTAPVVSITAPADGTVTTQGVAVLLSGTASDGEQGDLSSGLAWSSSLDGALGSGASLAISSLSVGSHLVTASVTDSYGAGGSDSLTITVNANTPPAVSITAPADGSLLTEGQATSLLGSASDAEDGDLSAAIAWSSDLDGVLGSGSSVSASLSRGSHLLTATITDSLGLQSSASVGVVVLSAPQVLSVTSNGTHDGWIRESSENSGVGGSIKNSNSGGKALRAGDERKDKQYRSIVSFDTSGLPDDAIITSVTLRVRRGDLDGTSPFVTHGNLVVDVKTGELSGDAALEKADFEAAADVEAAATMSEPAADLDWSEGQLDPSGQAAVNLFGLTQMRLRFELDDNDDRSSDFFGFYAGESTDPARRPELVVVYQVP